MSTIPYYVQLPEFQDQALLSATRVNQMLDNLDAVYGLDQRMVIGELYGFTSDVPRTWKGWVAYNGNELNLVLPTPTSYLGTYVIFDNTSKVHRLVTHFAYGTPAGLKTIPIPDDVGYEQFAIYQVYVYYDFPVYAWMSNNAAESIGLMPSFGNGSTSSAADLNLIINATKNLAEQFNQPVISGTRWQMEWLNNNAARSIRTYAPYRHTWFEFYLTAQSSSGPSGRAKDYLEWSVYIGGQWMPFWTLVLEFDSSNSPTVTQRVKLSDHVSLTVGTWYAFQFKHVMDDNSNNDGRTNLYWYGQQRNETAFAWTEQKRWTLGDTVNGSGTSNPRLDIMSANLTYLDGRRNTINQVMRQATNNKGDDNSIHYNSTVFARRVHRWLAYENASYDDPDTVVNEGDATLYYSVTRPNVFASVNLTTTYTTAYLDLDTTPIKPGMIFYASNVNYAIQVSDHP